MDNVLKKCNMFYYYT